MASGRAAIRANGFPNGEPAAAANPLTWGKKGPSRRARYTQQNSQPVSEVAVTVGCARLAYSG